MNIKGEGLPVRMIIVAMIVLIVLVLVVFMFQKQINSANDSMGSQMDCESRGGVCKNIVYECDNPDDIRVCAGTPSCTNMANPEYYCCCLPRISAE
ncbi:hypothetical protein JXB11_01125 [Candidatus Woesearchaeota archaeon]|nr:hypothetical protein [Candidatus Woesearchaeota archaeon]